MIKEVYLKQLKGNTFSAKSDSGHWICMDTKAESGGHNAAATPKEMVLMGLAGCTSSDVIPILRKMRSPVMGYECRIKAVERDEHPKTFAEIHIEYIFYGEGIKPEDVERAIDLSVTKYCSVSAMLSATAALTHSYRIEPTANMVA